MVFGTEIKALLLGFLQGVTEFLPISSSGHLVLLSFVLGFKEVNLFYVLVLHLGSLMAILGYYKKDILNILGDFCKNPFCLTGPGRWVYFVACASLPAVAGAFLLVPLVKKSFDQPFWVGLGFILTGVCLFLTRLKKEGLREGFSKDLSLKSWTCLLLVGVAQVLAFFPGISRSGWTISTALFLGFSRREAALFSFLLAIPAIIGAFLFEVISSLSIASEGLSADVSVLALALAFFSSWFFGWLALKTLIRSLETNLFPLFALYLWPLGCITLFMFF